MLIEQSRVRKILSRKVLQLNDILADLDMLLTEMETDYFRVCIFGSARINAESPFYKQVYDLAVALAKEGVDIVTGGGPGLMEAANKGAKEGGMTPKAGSKATRSIGLPIDLPFETDANSHLDVKRQHRRFSTRLDEFTRISHAVVVTPGGIGTVLELFYIWQLMQVGHVRQRPVLLVGRQKWAGLLDWLSAEPLKLQLMSQKDLEMLTIVDSVEEVVDHLQPFIREFRKKKENELVKSPTQV